MTRSKHDAERATFSEMAVALHELGFSESQIAETELLADQLRRAGMSQAVAAETINRMHRRNAAIEEARVFFERATPYQGLMREMTRDPPRWGVILRMAAGIVRRRANGVRHA